MNRYEDEAEKLTEAKIEMDIEEAVSHKKILLHPYTLQVGSFPTLERAKKAINLYRENGLSVYWVKVDLKEKGVWYRVFTGNFEDLEQLEKFKQEHGLTKSIVRKSVIRGPIQSQTFEGFRN